MPNRYRLTEKLVKGAPPRERDYYLFDEDVRGFGAVIYRSGGRGFLITYRSGGRKRFHTIGRWPDWTVVAAREHARLIRRDIDNGKDPQAERVERREVPTFADLADRYCREHLPRLAPRNASDQRSMLENLVLPRWRHRRLDEITSADVEDLLAAVADGRARPAKKDARSRGRRELLPSRPTPVRANRCGEVLRKMFNLATKKWRLCGENPADGFYRRLEVEREIFLSAEEIDRLATALNEAEDQRGAAIVRMCMLTGARLGEVREARFEQFNLDLLVWTKPAANTKQKKVHRVPISEDVAALVRLRQAAVGDAGWLFPGDALGADGRPKDQPVQDIRRFWSTLRVKAGLGEVRMHDLRHTFASLLASGGASLHMIGKLLGHAQSRTTQRYAHLTENPLRLGVAAVAEAMRPRPRLVRDS
jgi:integrase